jgi:RND family efflux transporter MFP subunit
MNWAPRNLFLFSITVCLLAYGCSRVDATSDAVRTKAPASAPDTVAVAKPVVEPLQQEVVLSGEFRPYQMVDLHAKVAGYLKQISVDVGDRVTSGQLLATLEIPEMDADLAHASAEKSRYEAELIRLRSEVQRAKANLDIIGLSHTRLTAAAKAEAGIIAQQEIDEVLARKRAAEAQLASAEAALGVVGHQIAASEATTKRVRTMASYSEIRAPFSGMITKRFADTGAMIQAGTASNSQALPLVRLAEISRLRMAVIVPESAVPMVKHGHQVEIRVPTLRKKFHGRVSRMSNDVQFSSRTMEAEVDVVNPSAELLPGMTAEVVLVISRKDQGLTVPVQAISNSGGNRSVMIVGVDGVIADREIKTGMEGAARIEVIAGLGPNDLVIVGNRSLLKAGQTVQTKLTEIN